MSDNRNTNPFWRNVATGVGVAAAGAVFAYLLNEVLNTPEEPEHEERTVATAVVASATVFFIYRQFNENENEFPNCRPRRDDRNSERRRRRNSSASDHRGFSELRTNIADKLNSGTYECIICLDEITRLSRIFSCKKCYTIYHLGCLRQHVSQAREAGKSPDCPTCRAWIPFNLQYLCFCGKQSNPRTVEGHTPHTCGTPCGSCHLLCHPGPCDL